MESNLIIFVLHKYTFEILVLLQFRTLLGCQKTQTQILV